MIIFPPSAAQIASARLVLSSLAAKGATKVAQYGSLANGDYESDLDPNAKGDFYVNGVLQKWSPHPTGTPTAFGLWQRQRDRLTKIIGWGGPDIYSAVMAGTNTIKNDVEGLWLEFQHVPSYGYATISKAPNVREAAILMCLNFEHALTSASDRGQRAESWLLELARAA